MLRLHGHGRRGQVCYVAEEFANFQLEHVVRALCEGLVRLSDSARAKQEANQISQADRKRVAAGTLMGNADLNVFDVHSAVPGLQHCLELYTRSRTLSGEVKLQLGHQNRQAESIVKQQQQHLHLKPDRRNANLKRLSWMLLR